MRIAVLGTGMVGQTLAPAFARLGHDVVLGTRDPAVTRARDGWDLELPLRPFEEAADGAELVVNATDGRASLDVLARVGAALRGRVLLDVANPLDFSRGLPPSLTTPGDDSLAEQIQRAHPESRVVKSLNTVNCKLMVDPSRVSGDSTVFVAGDDPEAKAVVRDLLGALGWRDVIDLGALSAARGLEMWLPLWVGLMSTLGTTDFNLRVVR
jgi:predicted dinucleotide-binding enzyme